MAMSFSLTAPRCHCWTAQNVGRARSENSKDNWLPCPWGNKLEILWGPTLSDRWVLSELLGNSRLRRGWRPSRTCTSRFLETSVWRCLTCPKPCQTFVNCVGPATTNHAKIQTLWQYFVKMHLISSRSYLKGLIYLIKRT